MAAPSSLRRWLAACALAASALALAALLLIQQRSSRARAPEVPEVTGPAAPRCATPPLGSVRALPHAEDPPVILWASGDVRLYLDGKAAFSPPESPRHFAVGEHLIRLEAEGHAPLETRVRFEAWTPALLHAAVDPSAGLTLVRLQAPCVSCPAALQPYARIGTRPGTRPAALLPTAADALRRGAWPEAMALLEQVPVAERRAPLFLRLASTVFSDTLSSEAAREALAALAGDEGGEMQPLLARHAALTAAEAARRRAIQLERWNRTTERFGALVERYTKELPQALGSAGDRLEALSPAFDVAFQQRDELGAEEALQAAEAELLQLATRLRAARPSDCDFQSEVVATATR